MLKDTRIALKAHENKDFLFVGLDFVVEFRDGEHKYKCMLCNTYLGKKGIIKHIQVQRHQTFYLSHCFPSIAKYMEKFTNGRLDGTLKLISTTIVKTLTTEVCKEITRRHQIDEFCPLLTQRTSEREFKSLAMMKYIVHDMPHIHENDHPETKKAIDEAVKIFIVKSKQLLAVAEGSDKIEIKEPPLKKLKVEDVTEYKIEPLSVMSQTELERMKVAISIATELVKNGLQISPSLLEESVKSYYKYEFQKLMDKSEFEALEVLTSDDLKLLIESFESLCNDEQEKLKKYLTMLKKIEDKSLKELILDANCAGALKNIIEM